MENDSLMGNAYAQPTGPDVSEKAIAKTWKMLWFTASLGMCVMGFAGAIRTFFSLEWVDGVEFIYMTIFSGLILCKTTPVFEPAVKKVKKTVVVYVHVLTRFTFTGIFFIFVGSSLLAAFMENIQNSFFWGLGIFAGFYGCLAGVASVAEGVRKTINLDVIRKDLKHAGSLNGELDKAFANFANPQQVITEREFPKLAQTQGKVFKPDEINLVLNALSSAPARNQISKEDFDTWVKSAVPAIL